MTGTTRLVAGARDYLSHVRGLSGDAKRLLWSQILFSTGLAVYSVFFNVYLKKGGIGEDFIGALASVTMLTSVLVGIPAGVGASRLGLRRALILSLPLMAFASAAQSLTLHRGVLVALAVVIGGSQMLQGASFFPLLTASSDEGNRHYLFSLSWAITNLTSVVGALVGGLLPHAVAGIFGWGEVGALRAAVCAGAVLASTAVLPARCLGAGGVPLPRQAVGYRAALGEAWRFAVLNLVLGLGAGFTIPFLSLYFATVFGLGPSSIGSLFAVSGALTGLAVLVTPLLVRRFGKLAAMLVTQAASIPLLLVLAHSRLVWLSVAAFWIRGALMNAATPILNQVVMEHSPEAHRPLVTNLVSLSWSVGWSLSVAVSGVVITRHGYLLPFYATVVVYLAYMVMLHRFFRHDPLMGRPDR